jgi:predicted PurR-regulated permease PerM
MPSASEGHHDLVGQPHTDEEGPIAEAEAEAAEISDADQPHGPVGKPFSRRSPFFIGLTAAAGVAVTYGLVLMVVGLREVLLLIGLSLFLAVGLEPAVSWLVGRRWPRWLAVLSVFLAALAVIAGFLAAAIPVLVRQATQFIERTPEYLNSLQDHNSWLGRLNERFHVQEAVSKAFSGDSLTGGLLGAGQVVFNALANLIIVVVLTVYFVVDLPRIRAVFYRLVPRSRRPRAVLIGDQIFAKVGSYVLGNLLISLIAGALTFVWLLILGVPYAALLAITVALLDLVPVAGSIIGGLIASLVALTVSLPVCLATVGFFVVYRFLEDYLLIPKIIGRVVKVPALVTIVAVLVGAALLGIIGALIAIPIAAGILLLVNEVVFPRLDRL